MVDIIVIVLLLIGAYLGYKRGFIPSLLSFLGSFIVLIIAFYLKNPVGELLYKTFPFIEFDGIFKGISSFNILLYQGIAFIICYIVLKILLKVIIKVSKGLESIISKIILIGSLSKLLGLLVGLLEYILYAYVILLVLLLIPKTNPYIIESKASMFILKEIPILSNITDNLTTSVDKIYKICNEENEDKDLETTKVLIENKIIDEKTVNDLIEKNKLKLKKIMSKGDSND